MSDNFQLRFRWRVLQHMVINLVCRLNVNMRRPFGNEEWIYSKTFKSRYIESQSFDLATKLWTRGFVLYGTSVIFHCELACLIDSKVINRNHCLKQKQELKQSQIQQKCNCSAKFFPCTYTGLYCSSKTPVGTACDTHCVTSSS